MRDATWHVIGYAACYDACSAAGSVPATVYGTHGVRRVALAHAAFLQGCAGGQASPVIYTAVRHGRIPARYALRV